MCDADIILFKDLESMWDSGSHGNQEKDFKKLLVPLYSSVSLSLCSYLLAFLSIFALSLGDCTKLPTRVDVSLNTDSNKIWAQLFKNNDFVSYRIVKTLIIKYGIYANIFAEKNVNSFCICKSFSHFFFRKNTCE